ncbi:MAG: LamG domain-containing protein [Planctomycetota bacterium]
MKRLLSAVVTLTMVSAASAVTTVTLVPIEEGESGSPSNPLQPSDEIIVWVTSDAGLFGLDCILTISGGPATIIDAMRPCWDPVCPIVPWPPGGYMPPDIDPDGKRAGICASTFDAPPSGVVGWFMVHCDGQGIITVELTGGYMCGGSMDINYGLPNIFGTLEIYAGSAVGPATYYVNGVDGNDLNDGLTPETAFATIQKGIDEADDDDTVLVYPGVYTEGLDFLGKPITVQSIDEPAVLRAPSYYAVSFYHGEDGNSVLKNFVIRDSYAGLFFYGASPTIRNVTVVDNVAGAWADGGGNPDISSSIFWDNGGADLDNCEATYSFARREIWAGLLAHWKFDEGSGTTAYDSAGMNHGTLMNGPVWTTGQIGGALEFDDVNDYVDVGDRNSLDFGAEHSFSIGAWIKTGADGPVVCKRRCGGTGGVYHEGYATRLLAGKPHFAIEDVAGSGASVHANTVVTDDQWHHVTAVRDATSDTLYLYLNGSSDATPVSDPTSESLATSRALEIGRSDITVAPGLSYFGGRIDDVCIYNRALDVNEIGQLYLNGLGPMFADANSGDYHLLSERGRYRSTTDEWILDDITSICVDGGDPAIEPSNERMPNGGRINMGAYGNTPYASMSEWPLQGDITRDGTLDWEDIAAVGAQWLAELDWAP